MLKKAKESIKNYKSANLKSGKFKDGELNIYDTRMTDTEIILKYQDLLPVLQQDNNSAVNARDLHNQLGVGKDFSTWIKEKIDNYGFEENADYMIDRKYNHSKINNRGGRNKIEYKLHIAIAKLIVKRYNTIIASEIYSYLNLFDNTEHIVVLDKRHELEFGKMLKQITKLDWITQYPIDNGKFRLDFYLNKQLIIEYDEYYHCSQSQIEKDNNRIKYCINWIAKNNEGLKCPVIRVKQGMEYDGLNKIIKYLINKRLIK